MTNDWLQWHQHYDTPNSELTHRLDAVHQALRRGLAEAPAGADEVVRLVSICAGEGRDVLPVLAERCRAVQATLLELDPGIAQRARTTVAGLGLDGVDVLIGDAGAVDTYRGLPPAHLLVASGVFGNVSVADMRRTVAVLPALLAADGMVVWTRSCGESGDDASLQVSAGLAEHGFSPVWDTLTPDGMFRVGLHRHTGGSAGIELPPPGSRMFTFVTPG